MEIVNAWLDRAQKMLKPDTLVFGFSIKFVEKIKNENCFQIYLEYSIYVASYVLQCRNGTLI